MEQARRHIGTKARRTGVSAFCVSAFCVSAFAQSGGGYNIKKSTIDSGGGTVTGGGYKLSGTVAQHDAGDPTGGGYKLIGGFWSPIAAPPANDIVWEPAARSCLSGTNMNQPCAIDADCPPLPPPLGICKAWPNNNPDATTRSLRFRVEGKPNGSFEDAIRVCMVDLQNPVPPNAIDLAQVVNKFKNVVGAPVKGRAQLQPNLPELNADINALDIVAAVDAGKGLAYPFAGPCLCPSLMTCGSLAPPAGTPCATPAVCVALSALSGGGAGAMCVKTCVGGTNDGEPCINNAHCPGGCCGSGCTPTIVGGGFCRDKCGRCN